MKKTYTQQEIDKEIEEYENMSKKQGFNDEITLKEFSGIVDKNVKTISRKISQGKVNPRKIKSQQGTLEYRFSDIDVKAFLWDELPLEIKSKRGRY